MLKKRTFAGMLNFYELQEYDSYFSIFRPGEGKITTPTLDTDTMYNVNSGA
jgi:hypothetical protein